VKRNLKKGIEAKELFAKLEQEVGVLEIDLLPKEEAQAIQDYLWELTDCRTVPRIFIKGKIIGKCYKSFKFIGGYDDTKDLFDKDELKNYL
jgi:glutaredoxin-related protein